MRLSFKFFCVAYIVVLLSTGIGGAYMIKSVNDTLWNTRLERVDTSVNYAIDSFLAYVDVSYNEINENERITLEKQIKNTLDGAVTKVLIYPDYLIGSFKAGEVGECVSEFQREDGRILMRTICILNTGNRDYYLILYSDFTDIQKQCNLFWRLYGIVVFGISAISGAVLYALAKTMTKPLNRLTRVADEIALGNYGKLVNTKSTDLEICALSESVNSMSVAIKDKIDEIGEELEKRDMFITAFTHEIKTPMTAIIGYAQMLKNYELDEKERGDAASSIYSEAKRLEKLSLQLLDLYVYKNEELEAEMLDLSSIKESLETSLKFLSERYKVTLDVSLSKTVVLANRDLLLSLICNLCDNAFKASFEGGCVWVLCEDGRESVKITVKDEGRGIAAENIKLLTEPFFRENKSRSRKLGGAGLGLSLCCEIARLHGTTLNFESEKGKGTSVSFFLKKAVM